MALFTKKTPTKAALADTLRPWIDPDLDAAMDQVVKLAPEPAVEFVINYLRPRRHDPERHLQAMEALGDKLSSAPDVMRARAGRLHLDDRDTGSDVLALLCYVLIDYGWQIRSGRPATMVSRDAFAHFHTVLQEADHAGAEALRLVPNHPSAAVCRLQTAIGLGLTLDEFWDRFAEARHFSPTSYRAHTKMLTALCDKWYGSDEAMFQFARQVAASVPPGDPATAMLPLAHAEYACRIEMLDPTVADGVLAPEAEALRRADLDAAIEASRRWCGGDGRTPPPHPQAVVAHNLFAGYFLFMPGQEERTRFHLEQCRGRRARFPWDYFSSQPEGMFRGAHTHVGAALPRSGR
jgi:hypothetical protein